MLPRRGEFMRLEHIVVVCMVLATSYAFSAENLELKKEKDKLSYTLGVNAGMNIKRNALDVDLNIFVQGMKDALTGSKLRLTDDEMKAVITIVQKDIQTRQQQQMNVQGEKNKKEGEAFLRQNKNKKGVKVLPSGLQYSVITEGKGRKPTASDAVTVNYKGMLIDGTEFDSSYKRGQPATFAVNGVIKGWTEALQLMQEGSKWKLFIPADLAYGDRGTPGGPIGPNAVLIFQVDLIAIEGK
jgi:FKBP-type peptidyl-prolyl cis-trans isomerase FklB